MMMHIVMWTFKEENKQENLDRAKEMLLDLKGTVPSLKHIEVGQDVKRIDGNYDMVLISEFNDLQGLSEYKMHKAHKEAAEFISGVRDKRVCVDYWID